MTTPEPPITNEIMQLVHAFHDAAHREGWCDALDRSENETVLAGETARDAKAALVAAVVAALDMPASDRSAAMTTPEPTILLPLSRERAETIKYWLDSWTGWPIPREWLKGPLNAALSAPPAAPDAGETTCQACGKPFHRHPDPCRFDHDFCEACIPAAMERFSATFGDPLAQARGAGRREGE